jgi:ABC transporter
LESIVTVIGHAEEPLLPRRAQPSPAIIEAIGLSKEYGHVVALADVELAVGSGEIYGLLGPNGAGKTTTLALLLGLLRPSAGRARIQGLDVVAQPVLTKRRVGYLPEQSTTVWAPLRRGEPRVLRRPRRAAADALGTAGTARRCRALRWHRGRSGLDVLPGDAAAVPTSQNSRLRHAPDSYTPSWRLGPAPLEPPVESADGDAVAPLRDRALTGRLPDRLDAEPVELPPRSPGADQTWT